MDKYLKYYWLEREYLEKEVRGFFDDKHYLTAEYFFSIIEWKNPKFGKMYLSYLRADEIKNIFLKIHSVSFSEKLSTLLFDDNGQKRKGIGLATASAILTTLYPNDFTVYDVRVRSLWSFVCPEDNLSMYPDISDPQKYYNDYLPKINNFAKKNNLSLRNCDRALWAKSWHNDLIRFIEKYES